MNIAPSAKAAPMKEAAFDEERECVDGDD